MTGTATHEWTSVYDAGHRSYVEDKLSKKNYLAPLGKPLNISLPKVEKPTYVTELYYHASFHTDRREISVLGQKYTFFLIGDSPGGYRCMLYIFGKLSSSQCCAPFDIKAVTYPYRFRDIRGQNFGFRGAFGVPLKREDIRDTQIP